MATIHKIATFKFVKNKFKMRNLLLLLLMNMSLFTNAQKKSISVEVQININTSKEKTFNYIVPIDLSHIFKGYKNLPAVVRTSNKEKWFKAGQSRTVFFDDSTIAKETLVEVIPSTSFSYKIEDFNSSLKYITKRIDGKWVFTEKDNKTYINWTYEVNTRNIFSRIVFHIAVKKKLKRVLENALAIIKDDLETKPN